MIDRGYIFDRVPHLTEVGGADGHLISNVEKQTLIMGGSQRFEDNFDEDSDGKYGASVGKKNTVRH